MLVFFSISVVTGPSSFGKFVLKIGSMILRSSGAKFSGAFVAAAACVAAVDAAGVADPPLSLLQPAIVVITAVPTVATVTHFFAFFFIYICLL
ncbi:hypothetical protein D3C85_1412360 [compost metagenome]